MGLNSKHKLFVKEYLKDQNAGRAYAAAGYTGKGRDQSAHALLRNPEIKKAVEKGLADLADKADISAERVIRRISEMAFHVKDIKKSDVLKACELLGKHFKLFTDVQEITGRNGGPQVILTMPANGSEALPPKKRESSDESKG